MRTRSRLALPQTNVPPRAAGRPCRRPSRPPRRVAQQRQLRTRRAASRRATHSNALTSRVEELGIRIYHPPPWPSARPWSLCGRHRPRCRATGQPFSCLDSRLHKMHRFSRFALSSLRRPPVSLRRPAGASLATSRPIMTQPVKYISADVSLPRWRCACSCQPRCRSWPISSKAKRLP